MITVQQLLHELQQIPDAMGRRVEFAGWSAENPGYLADLRGPATQTEFALLATGKLSYQSYVSSMEQGKSGMLVLRILRLYAILEYWYMQLVLYISGFDGGLLAFPPYLEVQHA